MNISNYLEAIFLDWSLKGNSGNHSPPSAVYVGLASDSATDAQMEAGNLTHEITGYNGDRKLVTFGSIQQDSDGYSYVQNTAALDFENMPVCTVKYVFIADSPTKGQGNILWWGALNPAKQIANAGDTFRIPAGSLTVKIH